MKSSEKVVKLLFFLMTAFLLFLSIYNTCYLPTTGTETTYFVQDHPLKLICVLVVLAGVVTVSKKCRWLAAWTEALDEDSDRFLRIKRIFLGVLLLEALVWVLSTRFVPMADTDQAAIQNAVYALHLGDYGIFEKGHYMAMYPNQLGLLFVNYVLSLVFGCYNYVLLEVLNALAFVMIYKQLSEIGGKTGLKHTGQLLVLALGILFLPLVLYCSFVYGNLLGLAFALTAIKYEMVYFEEGKKRHAAIAVAAIMISVLLKSNYLIFLVAMCIYAFLEFLSCKKIRTLAFLLLMVLGVWLGNLGVNTWASHLHGQKLEQGMSSWSWVAMGLQEGERAPGWFNAYNMASYEEANYDTALQAQNARENIAESLRNFAEHPTEAIQFFTRKLASEWNNPTFEGFSIVHKMDRSGSAKSDWVWKLLTTYGVYQWAKYLNILQSFVLLGVVFWILLHKKEENRESLVLPIIFIGGFLFHLFWEAKCQYTIIYFVLLFPYAVLGYQKMADGAVTLIESKKLSRPIRPAFWILALFLAVIFAIYGAGEGACLREDTDAYFEYLESRRNIEEHERSAVVTEGEHQFVSAYDNQVVLGMAQGIGLANLEEQADANATVVIKNYQGSQKIRFLKNGAYLTRGAAREDGKTAVTGSSAAPEAQQDWSLVLTEVEPVGTIYIMCGSDYLTYDMESGAVWLEPYNGHTNQKWFVR